jgi:hypothetical protein
MFGAYWRSGRYAENLGCSSAVLELLPGRVEETARAYRLDHSDRAGALSGLLAVLDPPGPAAGLPGLRSQAQAARARSPSMSAGRYGM